MTGKPEFLRRDAIKLLAAGMSAALTGCVTLTSSFRYRMIFTGRIKGSAVYEIFAEKLFGLRLPEEKPGGSIIFGDALTLRNGDDLYFAPMVSEARGHELKGAVMRALAPQVSTADTPYSWAATRELAGAKEREFIALLPREEWPLVVRFRDIQDPESIEYVDPPSIGVENVIVETTRAEITTGIEQHLKWIGTDRLTFGVPSVANPVVAGIKLENGMFRSRLKK